MKVHDVRLLSGGHEFSIAEDEGEIKFIILNYSLHLTLDEFEEMAERVRDFEPEEQDNAS